MKRTRLKVCCIQSVRDALLAVEAGADAIGLVAKMPSGPGPIPDDRIAEIVPCVPPPIGTFLLTSETDAESIVDHIRRTRANTVQIVDDDVNPDVYKPIRDELPGVKIVQVIHVQGDRSIQKALHVSRMVDALLLDSGNPAAEIRELGGTGRVHNWEISRQIVEQSPKPVFLAGGINPENVAAAITRVRPFGIDVCSGVRKDGDLSREKLIQLLSAIDAASCPLH